MAILACFEHGPTTRLPQDVSAELGLPLPTVYRLMQAMSDHGLLALEGRQFRLGFRLASLGHRALEGLDIRAVARPHLAALGERTGETAHLSIRQGAVRVLIEQVSSNRNVRPFALIGEPLPLGVGAAGLVLLAWMPIEEAIGLMRQSLTVLGLRTEHTPERLAPRLELLRKQGFAVSRGERQADVTALAAPVWDATGAVVAVVSLVVPTVRMDPARVDETTRYVVQAAIAISKELGFVAPP
ncbi:IclR family transcriptional regulator [Humitalea sp. 24SJ18S-53]|uniref:IclR family transcriptional regulator n=1 Tax=Humitalea sp. 24SJ18S-53 TaxID=3422307 RepID=UPI003D666EBE